MAAAKTAELLAEIVALKARVEALEAANAAKPAHKGAWQPSAQFQALKAECLRRTAAGEKVKIQSGVVVAY